MKLILLEYLYEKMVSRCLYNSNNPLLNTTFAVPIKKEDLSAVNGQFKIGRIAYTNIDFGLNPHQLQMHSIIGGGSGYGKSTLIKLLSQQIITDSKIKVWIIDPKEGGDYRFLARQFDNVIILRPEVLRCNPFSQIANVPIPMLRETLAEVMADSFGVYDASEGIIAKHIQKNFEQSRHPCFSDFAKSIGKETVRFTGGRKQGYLDSLDTRLVKTRISLGEIVNCGEDYFSMLYDKNLVIETGELSGTAQRILVPWIIMKLVLYKIKNPTPNLSHLLLFDEAQSQIWSKNLELRGRQSYMGTLANQVRAFGLGIVVLAQNPAMKLMSEIIANTCVKICFHLGSGVEITAMSHHLGLNQDQMDMLYHLDKQEAICRVGLGYMEPVLLEIYDFEDKPVSNDELTEIMKPHWDMLLEKVKPVEPDTKPESQPEKTENTKNTITTKNENDSLSAINIPADLRSAGFDASSDLSLEEQAYLRVISTHPWRLVTEIYTILNDEKVMGNARISRNNAVKIRQRLLKKKNIESVIVLGTGKSGKSQCDVITEKSRKDTGGKSNNHRGGYLHNFWCYRVGEYYKRKSAVVKLSDTLNGNECDLDVTVSGIRIGIEVVITSLVMDNLKRNISSRYFDKVLILVIDEREREKIESQIIRAGIIFNEKVEVGLLKDYFITL